LESISEEARKVRVRYDWAAAAEAWDSILEGL
jgi:hypothetical protein